MANCQDDLTLTDLLISSSAASRLTSGSAASSNLYGQIDRDQVYGLNLDVPRASATTSTGEGSAGEAKVVVKSWEDRDDELSWVDSGVDDQLILNIPFIQNVRVRSIILKTGRGEYAPSVLRLYANRAEGITFSDAEPPESGGLKPSQEISLLSSSSPSSTGGVHEYPLKVQVFKDVVSLSLFFGDAEGGERTRVYFVGFLGDPRNPDKEKGEQMTIPAAQGADAPIGGLKETSAPRNTTIR